MKMQTLKALVSVLLLVIVSGCGESDKQVGMIVIYELESDQVSNRDKLDEEDIQKLVAVVDRRLNPKGRSLGSVRQLDDSRIEVSIYRADPDEMKRIANYLVRSGSLEFRVLANSIDHADLIALAKASEDEMVYQTDNEKKLVAKWVPVKVGNEDKFAKIPSVVARTKSEEDGETLEILIAIDPFNVSGEYIASCTTGYDEYARPCVNFFFNDKGGRLFSGLTSENIPDDITGRYRYLGIILEGELYSAPSIRGVIGTQGQITGKFAKQEAEDLAGLLEAGSLPFAIRKVEQRVIDAKEQASPK